MWVVPSSPGVVYLHIGPPKTGTTFLQDVIWRNRDVLAESEIGVPGRGYDDHFFAVLDVRGIQFGGYDDPRAKGAWRRLADNTHRLSTPRALISHEIFAGAHPDQIATITADLAPAEVHLIYAVRDLARQLPAVWQEMLKNRKAKAPFERFVKTALRKPPGQSRAHFWRAQDPATTLARWLTVVPPQNVHVLTVAQSGRGGGSLLERFCTVLDVDPARLDTNVARSNRSLTQEHADLLVRLNRALPPDLFWPAYEELVKNRFNRAAGKANGQRLVVPERYRDLVSERTAETCAFLAGSGFDIVGDLDDLVPVDSAFGSGYHPDPAGVADAATQMLADLVQQLAALQGRRSRELAHRVLARLRRSGSR